MIKSTGQIHDVDEVGYFVPELKPTELITAGDVAMSAPSSKKVGSIHVGDTIIPPNIRKPKPFPAPPHPADGVLRHLPIKHQRLHQTDRRAGEIPSSTILYHFEKESSAALGWGYRLGFMGMLHMEITLERLKREYGQELIATMPSVIYKVVDDRRAPSR